MEKIVIIGAGGFGREVKVLIDQINEKKPTYLLEGFYDDDPNLPDTINGIPLLGNLNTLLQRIDNISIAIAIGIPKIKKEFIEKLKPYNFSYPTLIHPNVIIGNDNIKIGKGTIICAGNILTCDIVIENFVTLNLYCTIGHDTKIKSFSSFMPSVNISGEVTIESCVYSGTGVKIINQLSIGENTIIGAGAVISKNLPPNCTAVGIPAKPIKFHK